MDRTYTASPGAAYFLGANTPGGFYSLFSELTGPGGGRRLLIVKGGPGTGKSTLMKRLAAEAERRGLYCERIFCSSDPQSLDAVILPGLRLSVADGTPPHALEPRYPGAFETLIDLGRFRDDRPLRAAADEIVALTDRNRDAHAECTAFLKAAGSVAGEVEAAAAEALQTEKLQRFARRLAETLCPAASSGPGRREVRFLSALTPQGLTVFYDTFYSRCEHTVALRDPYGAAAPAILETVYRTADAAGLDTVRCVCPMSCGQKLEHLLVPQLGLGLCTANDFHPFEEPAQKTVNCLSFYRAERLKAQKNRLRFCRRAQRELLDAALEKLSAAKKLHDELERYYIRAMDFPALNAYAEALLGELFGE